MTNFVNKLLTIKSLVTLTLTLLMCYCTIAGVVDGGQIITIYQIIIAFYFGTQTGKG